MQTLRKTPCFKLNFAIQITIAKKKNVELQLAFKLRFNQVHDIMVKIKIDHDTDLYIVIVKISILSFIDDNMHFKL